MVRILIISNGSTPRRGRISGNPATGDFNAGALSTIHLPLNNIAIRRFDLSALAVRKIMGLYEFISQFKHLYPVEKKYHVDSRGEYAQLVFDSRDLPNWYQVLVKLMGPPLKAKGQPVTDELARLTEDLGGIFDHQTLFCLEKEHQRVLAMFWPWRNRDLITLKVMVSRG